MHSTIPGTNKPLKNDEPFKVFKQMIELGDGISLGQVSSITGLDPLVIQNWVKREYVSRPIKKKYYEKQLARILMINSLREVMKIEDIGNLMTLINGDVEDESDDLISEENLYSLFVRVIYNLESVDDIEKTIKNVMKTEKRNDEKLKVALETMIYAYLASEMKKVSKGYLNKLETM